jgi:hypothetical protein
MFTSIILNIISFVLVALMKFNFDAGNYLTFIITMFNVSGILIKNCIFDKGLGNDLKYITIWWLCCLTIGDKPRKKALKTVTFDQLMKEGPRKKTANFNSNN